MLNIHVQDQMHTVTRSLSDADARAFLAFSRDAAARGATLLSYIDPYADTLFNFKQIDLMLSEIDDELHRQQHPDEQREAAAHVRVAAVEARRMSGYLLFEGD
jgi:hypothetical protein